MTDEIKLVDDVSPSKIVDSTEQTDPALIVLNELKKWLLENKKTDVLEYLAVLERQWNLIYEPKNNFPSEKSAAHDMHSRQG